MFFQAKSFVDVYPQIAKQLLRCTDTRIRNINTRELPACCFQVENPAEMFQLPESRLRYLVAEILWYASGDYTIDWISKYSSFWKQLADENGNVSSNYGHLIFRDQNTFWRAYNLLVEDASSRQAICHLNLPHHFFAGNSDLPCTLSLQFLIRDNRLHLITTMRSNDIWFGTTYDLPNFSIFQQTMMLLLRSFYPDLELGWYQHQAGSMHVYDRNYRSLEKFVAAPLQSLVMHLKQPLITLDGSPTTQTTNLADDFFAERLSVVEVYTQLFE